MAMNPSLTVCAGALVLGMEALGQGQPAEAPPPYAVLEDVPRVGYDVHLCPFPGSLHACLQYLGDAVEYDYLMGVTGAAFRRLWNRDDGGNVDLMYLAPEPHRRAFEALGYELRTVPRNRTAMEQAIVKSISAAVPVLSFGMIGPPEAGIVTGYDTEADVLHGWSYFQDRSKPGYYELSGWFEAMSEGPPFGLIVITNAKEEKPAPREVLASSLEWALDLARKAKRPGLPDHVSGLAAYDAWADGLEIDADYLADDRKIMQTRAMVHCDQVVMLAERREAAKYLRRMAGTVPAVAEPLNAAAELYDAAAACKVWRWGHWQQPAALKGMADATIRWEFAASVRQAKAKEAQAVELLAKALSILRGGAAPKVALTHLELQGSKLVNYPPEFRPNIECMPVPGVFRAMMEFMGEDFGYTTSTGGKPIWRTNEAFPLFMGVWGDSFEFVWLRKDGMAGTGPPSWPGNVLRRFVGILDAAGFEAQIAAAGGRPGLDGKTLTREELREAIVESIADRGWPVLLTDVPTPGRILLATGYDRAGDVLIGCSVEGGDDDGIRFLPEERMETDEWFEQAGLVVVLTGKRERQPEPAVYRAALEQGLVFLRMREAGEHHAGPATFDAWAQLLADPTLSADGAATKSRRRGILDPMIWDLATRRHYGALFLKRAAELYPPAATHLEAAAACFRAEHDMMWKVNSVAGGKWPGGDLPKLGDPTIRKQIAAVLLEARGNDLEAADHIERALGTMGAGE